MFFARWPELSQEENIKKQIILELRLFLELTFSFRRCMAAGDSQLSQKVLKRARFFACECETDFKSIF